MIKKGKPERLKKGGWKYGVTAGLLKREGWHFSYLILSRFIIFTCRNYPLQSYYAFEGKVFFFCHHNFVKKGNSKLSKNEPENIL